MPSVMTSLLSRTLLILLCVHVTWGQRVAPTYQHGLQASWQTVHQARTRTTDRPQLPSELSDLHRVLDLTSSDVRGALLEAALTRVASSGSDDVSVGEDGDSLCGNHTAAVVIGLLSGQPWALQMVDAMGKPGPGVTQGNLNWIGGYTQCRNVRANTTVTTHPFFSGQYCTAYSTAPPVVMSMTPPVIIQIGLCIPDTCSGAQFTELLQFVVKSLNLTSASLKPVVACTEEDKPFSGKAIAATIICSIILLLMVVGTALDLVLLQLPQWMMEKEVARASTNGALDDGPAPDTNETRPLLTNGLKMAPSSALPDLSTWLKCLVSFSVYTNGRKLLTTSQPAGSLTCVHGVRFLSISWVVLGHTWTFPAQTAGVWQKCLVSFSVYTNGRKLLATSQPAGSLTCVHGVRFLSISWVVMGHTWLFPMQFAGANVLQYLTEHTSRWTFQGICNATVSVDSFFVLSGLLVTYLTLKEMKKKDGKMNWFLFYFHRFWRLTPAYMLSLMVSSCLGSYMGQGPIWPEKFMDEDMCADYWWTNLLYINNFFGFDEQCFGHSWYLANDMQFYILAPLIFVPLFFWPAVGAIVSAVFLLATAIVPGVISSHFNLPPGIYQQVEGQTAQSTIDYFTDYYLKPYNRMGAYVVGMLAGYFLYRTDCRLRLPSVVNLLLWSVATGCALAVLYGLYEATNGHPVTVPVSAFYNAVNRQVWAACVAWVVVACVTGNGGFVNTLLSWSAFVPLSRLSYCVYLLHILVITVYSFNRDTVFSMTDVNLTMLFLAVMVLSFMVAFVASLAFEAPMMGLEKVLLHRTPQRKAYQKIPSS